MTSPTAAWSGRSSSAVSCARPPCATTDASRLEWSARHSRTRTWRQRSARAACPSASAHRGEHRRAKSARAPIIKTSIDNEIWQSRLTGTRRLSSQHWITPSLFWSSTLHSHIGCLAAFNSIRISKIHQKLVWLQPHRSL